MAFLAVDNDGSEFIYKKKPTRKSNDSEDEFWYGGVGWFGLPKGSILKLIGRELTWQDEPVEI